MEGGADGVIVIALEFSGGVSAKYFVCVLLSSSMIVGSS